MNSVFSPTVVVRRDGALGIELTTFDGYEGIPGRALRGAYFGWRARPGGPERRLVVGFSYQTELWSAKDFGLPSGPPPADDDRLQFALATVGEHLDTHGGLPEGDADSPMPELKCLSYDLEGWKTREPSADDAIEHYLEARLYWTWKFGQPGTRVELHDLLRLGAKAQDFARIETLGEGTRHTRLGAFDGDRRLKPTRDLILTWQARGKASPAPPSGGNAPAVLRAFVDESRIAALRDLPRTAFDYRRLVGLCEELNRCHAAACHSAVAALTRAVLDHVPPVFGVATFREVASQHGGKSFKAQMHYLEQFSRKVADEILHAQIRRVETLPTAVQVDCSAALDSLLAEVARHGA